MKPVRWLLLLALGLALGAHAQALRPVPVVTGLQDAWAFAPLPDGRLLITEKGGRLRITSAGGNLSAPLSGLPAISVGGQCGLLDVVLDPAFASNRRFFFTFAEPGEGGNSTAVGSARLVADRLQDVRTIFSQRPKINSRQHCGSRIVFDRSGHLLVGLGDRFSAKEEAQNLGNHIGKVVRITTDGTASADNPFVGRSGAAPEVYSLGHRNIQGAALHPVTGELWAAEHGPQGGDEVNRVRPGLNSVAPSGLAFLTSDRYPAWKGNLFMGTLRGQALIRLTLDGNRVTGEERLLEDLNARIRDVRQGPDGWLYVLTDGADGRLLRLER